MKFMIFLDMDDVLVDFTEGYLKLVKRMAWPYPPDGKHFVITPEQWRELDYEFFRTLNWRNEGHRLIPYVEEIFGAENVFLLTDPFASSPAGTQGIMDGKVRWVEQHLPKYSRRIIFTNQKHLLAAHGRILIDDSDRWALEFRRFGGWSILMPHLYNSRRDEVPGAEITVMRELMEARVRAEVPSIHAIMQMTKPPTKADPVQIHIPSIGE